MKIGGKWHPTFNGFIDEVRIYNRAFSDDKIEAIKLHLGYKPKIVWLNSEKIVNIQTINYYILSF